MLISELTERFLLHCSRHRSPATLAFYRARLKKFCRQFNARELASLTPLEMDEHLAEAGAGMSDNTPHDDALALELLQACKQVDSKAGGTCDSVQNFVYDASHIPSPLAGRA